MEKLRRNRRGDPPKSLKNSFGAVMCLAMAALSKSLYIIFNHFALLFLIFSAHPATFQRGSGKFNADTIFFLFWPIPMQLSYK